MLLCWFMNYFAAGCLFVSFSGCLFGLRWCCGGLFALLFSIVNVDCWLRLLMLVV